jgi:hypothetical protein
MEFIKKLGKSVLNWAEQQKLEKEGEQAFRQLEAEAEDVLYRLREKGHQAYPYEVPKRMKEKYPLIFGGMVNLKVLDEIKKKVG